MIADQIRADLTVAMKAGDGLRVSVLRMVLSEMNYKKIDLQRELTDGDALVVIQKEAKKRREAIDSFRAGGRPEQVVLEEQELAMLTGYLPVSMSEEEVRVALGRMELPAEFGAAMKLAAAVFKGRADGALVARIVKEITH